MTKRSARRSKTPPADFVEALAIEDAKNPETRARRIAKSVAMIALKR